MMEGFPNIILRHWRVGWVASIIRLHFWIDNRTIQILNYMKYAVSVSDLEKNTGFEFFPGLDESIKSQLDLSKWQ